MHTTYNKSKKIFWPKKTYVSVAQKIEEAKCLFFFCLAIILAVDCLGLPICWLEFDYSNLGSIPYQK